MEENELWDKFTANGRVDDYLKYREYVEMNARTELKPIDENKHCGLSDKRTDCWRV